MKLRDACVIFFLSGVMDIDVFQFFSLLPYQRFGNDFLSKPRSTQRWGGGIVTHIHGRYMSLKHNFVVLTRFPYLLNVRLKGCRFFFEILITIITPFYFVPCFSYRVSYSM